MTEATMKVRTLSLILGGAVLFCGCGQKAAPEPWSEKPGEARRAQSSENVAARKSYDLSREEGRGGHTLRQHVGRTDDELRQRLERERDISAASTWADRATAEETVAAALEMEHLKIANWQRRGERRPNLALHFDARHEIGRSLLRGAARAIPCSEAVIVLRADGEGFYVLTAYPETRE
jgi:Bacterial CdiA-CT RNAse A domain